MDADHVRDLATPIIPSGARHACAAAPAQAGDELAAKLAARLRIDGGVDGLVGHVALGLIGEHALEGTRDLLRRPLPLQQHHHHTPGNALHVELARRARGHASPLAVQLRRVRGVRSSARVLRSNSRLMVDTERPSMRAMARMLEPCWRMLAIVTRSSG